MVGDRTLLRRLVRNLLENARRHGHGSPVELGREARPGPRAHLRRGSRSRRSRERARAHLRAVLPPAGASESKDGSFGLGLALVRQIARHHGGDGALPPARRRRNRVRSRSRRCRMTVSAADHPGVIAKPPSLFLVALALGFALELASRRASCTVWRASRSVRRSSAAGSGSWPPRSASSAPRARTSRRTARPRRSCATGCTASRATRSTSAVRDLPRARGARRQPVGARARSLPLLAVIRFGVIAREEATSSASSATRTALPRERAALAVSGAARVTCPAIDGGHLNCASCGRANRPGARFCDGCGPR